MKALLEESLMDVPSPEEGFDIQKLFTEKTEADKECINRAVRASVMLQSMSNDQMEMIYGVIQPLNVKKDDWIIRQGDEGDRFYIVGKTWTLYYAIVYIYDNQLMLLIILYIL